MKTLILWLSTLPLAWVNAQTVLEWKFTPGEEQPYRLNQTARLTSGTEESPKLISEVAQQLDFTWRVVDIDAEGGATISLKLISFSLTAIGPGGQEVIYDSISTAEPEGYASMLVPISRRFSEAEVWVSMTREGQVTIKELPSDLSEAVKAVPGGKLFAQDGGLASFESLARLGAPLAFPPEEVFAGKNWTESTQIEVPPLGKGIVRFTYTLQQLKENEPVIIDQKMNLVPDEAAQIPLLREETSAGIITLDPATRRPEKTTLTYKAMLVSQSDRPGGDVSEPMRLEQRIEFSSLSDATQ